MAAAILSLPTTLPLGAGHNGTFSHTSSLNLSLRKSNCSLNACTPHNPARVYRTHNHEFVHNQVLLDPSYSLEEATWQWVCPVLRQRTHDKLWPCSLTTPTHASTTKCPLPSTKL
eukprot:2719266-Amphidinium_carterae.2